jgi:hypothetical protein
MTTAKKRRVSDLYGVKIGDKKVPLEDFKGYVTLIDPWNRCDEICIDPENDDCETFADFETFFARRLSSLEYPKRDESNKADTYPIMWRPIRPGLHGVALRMKTPTERFFNPIATAFVTLVQDLSGFPLAQPSLKREIYGPLALVDVRPKSPERCCLDLLTFVRDIAERYRGNRFKP